MAIIIGMGTGRSGTMSLSRLISAQNGAVCFHELNPACMKWSGANQTVLSMIREFEQVLSGGSREVTIDFTSFHKDESIARLQALPAVHAIGDVALYYLSYAPMLASLDVDIRMPCLRREKAAVVDSFLRSARLPEKKRPPMQRLERRLRGKRDVTHVNHWMNHDGSVWRLAPKWDKLFPKFDATDMASAISAYWDHYDHTAREYETRFPDAFKIFDIEKINSIEGRKEILDFCGVAATEVSQSVHLNSV